MNKLSHVCAIMVTHNRLNTLKKSLFYLLDQTAKPDAVVVVNNNSSDGTEEFLASLKNTAGIDSVNVKTDIGFGGGLAKGVEYAMKHGDYDYFWFVEDDSFYENNTLEKLIANIEGSGFDYLGLDEKHPPLFLYNGKSHRKNKNIFSDKPLEADFVMIDGALLTVNMVRQIGPPTDILFMMCEEDEYCMRLKKSGFKAGFLNIKPLNRLHLGGEGRFTRSTLWRGYYQARNSILLLKKYFSFKSLFGFIIRQSKFLIASALYAPDRFLRIKLRLIGLWHGIKGIQGKTLDPDSLKFENKKQTSVNYSVHRLTTEYSKSKVL